MRIGKTSIFVVLKDAGTVKADAVVVMDGGRTEGRKRKRILFRAADTRGRVTEKSLRQACLQSFSRAEREGTGSLAFAVGNAGAGDFPFIGLAKIMAQETLRYFRRQHSTCLRRVYFCIPDRKQCSAFKKNLLGYIRHVIEDLGRGPYVAVDAVVELPEGIVLIERSNPPYGWALPGGFVDEGESVEHAIRREIREETALRLTDFQQMHVYSDPRRDPRFHTVTVLFVGKGKGRPKAGDDAKGLRVIAYKDLLKQKYAFDHHSVIRDYLAWRRHRRLKGSKG